MRTGFLSALTVLITAQSLQFYQLMNLQRELARNGTELSSQRTWPVQGAGARRHTHSTVSRHTLSPADGNGNPAVAPLSTD